MPRYTRDELVDMFTDFYSFLTKMHIGIPRDALQIPPPGGWPNLTPEKCRAWGKTDFVVNLLAHMPYIKSGDRDYDYIHFKSNLIDWSSVPDDGWGEDWLRHIEITASSEFVNPDGTKADRVPPHIVSLATGYESGGRDILLDTEAGELIVEEIRCGLDFQDDVHDALVHIKDLYLNLHLIIVPGVEAIERSGSIKDIPITELPDPMAQRPEENYWPTETDIRWLRHIFRTHDWPSENWRKEEAAQAVEAYLRFRQGNDDDEDSEKETSRAEDGET